MSKLYKVTMRIAQAGWCVDCYGNPEVEPKSIRVPVIMVYKCAGDYSLYEAKCIADKQSTNPKGSEYMVLLGDDGMVGRLAALEHQRRSMRIDTPDMAEIEIVSINEVSVHGATHIVRAKDE